MSEERRRSPRIALPVRAFVRSHASAPRVEVGIRDLSVTGARLVGATELHVFEKLAVDLELPGDTVTVIAEVVRVDTQEAQAAVAFVEVAPQVRDAIDRAIASFLATVAQTAVPVVLVYGVEQDTGEALERDLAQLGRRAQLVANRLEIERTLADASVRCVGIVLGSDASDATDVLAFVAGSFPAVRRIVMFSQQLGALDRTASKLVDAVLRTPLRIRPLARALGIDADRSSMMRPEDI